MEFAYIGGYVIVLISFDYALWVFFFFYIKMKYMYKCIKCNIHVMCRCILFTTFDILLLKF